MSYFQTKFWSTTHKHFLCLIAEYWVFSGPRVVVSLSLMGNILKTTFLFDGMVAYIKVSASSKCKVWNCKWFYNFALYISLYALILRSSGMVGVLYKKRQGGFQFGIWNVSVFWGGGNFLRFRLSIPKSDNRHGLNKYHECCGSKIALLYFS